MDQELSEMLRVWGQRGPTLISAVLDERKRLLDLAALHRDDLSAQLFEAQNEITMLREQVRQQQNEHQKQQSESCSTATRLHASISSLTKELQEAKKVRETMQSKLELVTKERDNAISLIDERERSAENMMAALQKSMHSEAKAKSTARDSIRDLQEENIEYSHLVVGHRLKAEKESRRADAAEKKALDLQERLDKILTEKSITSEDRSRTHTDPVKQKGLHVGTKRKSASSSRLEVMGPTVEDIPSEVTQNDESVNNPPKKKRCGTRSAEKRKVKVIETVENNSDDLVRDSSRIQSDSGIDGTHRDRQAQKRLATRSAEKRKSKETETVNNSSDELNRNNRHFPSESRKHSEPRKVHGHRKRRTLTPTSLLLPCEKKPLKPGVDRGQPTPSKYERPRRNLPRVSYVYPVQGDCDVQTRDMFCIPSSKAPK